MSIVPIRSMCTIPGHAANETSICFHCACVFSEKEYEQMKGCQHARSMQEEAAWFSRGLLKVFQPPVSRMLESMSVKVFYVSYFYYFLITWKIVEISRLFQLQI